MSVTTVNRKALNQKTQSDSREFSGQERSLQNEVNLSQKKSTEPSMSEAIEKSPHHPHVYRVNIAFVGDGPVVL